MRRTRTMWAVVLVAGLAVIAAACSDDKSTTSAGGASSSAPSGASVDYSKLTGTLNGSGSSFQDAFDQKAKTEFAKVASGVTVNYTKSGSGAGKKDLANQVVQFAGTDSLISAADLPTFKGGEVLYFPTVAAPITVSYNLKGVDKLQLSAPTLAKIFQGTITSWDDAAIKADNPGASLPAKGIVVVHRSDASGTTSNFTNYLKKAAGSDWTLDAGDTVSWPATTQGAEKNSGVASVVSTTEGAVGYVDLADAVNANLQLAAVKNKAGQFAQPTLDAASKAIAGTDVKADLTYSPLDATGDGVYPITSPTWIIVYKKQPDKATADALKGWLNFILTNGQQFASNVGYAPIPSSLQQKAITQLESVTS